MDKDKQPSVFASRKYTLTMLIFAVASCILFLPPVVSVFVFKHAAPLIILSGTEWSSLITIIAGLYFGANVAQKKLTGGAAAAANLINNTPPDQPTDQNPTQ